MIDLQELEAAVVQVTAHLQEIAEGLKGIPLSLDLHQALDQCTKQLDTYHASEGERKLTPGRGIGIWATNAAHTVQREHSNLELPTSSLLTAAQELKRISEEGLSRPADFNFKRSLSSPGDQKNYPLGKPAAVSVEEVKAELDRHSQLIKKDLKESQDKAADLSKAIKSLSSSLDAEVSRIVEAQRASLEEIEAKKVQADESLSLISEKVIAGDYGTSAAAEKRAADWLRVLAIAVIIVIVVLVGWTSLQSVSGYLEWQEILARLGLALTLALPTGYLARESAKHRRQQYAYQQTSLVLRTLDAYLSPLPDEQRHEIKGAVAQRIFSPDEDQGAPDPGFINANEIVLEAVKALARMRGS